jgi:hypothetical protein
MIKALYSALCFISLSCQAQHPVPKFTLDDMAITVEKFDSLDKDDNRYNRDNKIYRVGRKFTFSYSYQDKAGVKMLMAKADTIGQSGATWKLVPADIKNPNSVSHFILSVTSGLMPFIQIFPDYNQTVILYDFKLLGGESWNNEMTGVIENSKNLWLHPPRTGLFKVLELNPFPYVKQPLKVGAAWTWKLEFGDQWADKRWLLWKGKNENKIHYKVTGKSVIQTKLGALKCYVVESEAKSALGSTKLVSYYHDEFGFVKLVYTNIDGSKMTLELQSVDSV